MFHRLCSVRNFLAIVLLIGSSQAAQAALSGDYTIAGTNPDYATIGAAVSDLNSQGISGPVNFILRTGAYDEQVTIQNFTRSGNADDEVTFRKVWPFNSVYWKYSSANSAGNNFVLKLVGASHVTIRGIHFQAEASAAPYGNLVVLSDGATDITISGAIFTGLSGAASDDGSLIRQTGAGANANFQFTSNTFTNGHHAIGMNLAGPPLQGLLIDDNEFTDQERGAVLASTKGAVITKNEISDGATSHTSLYSALQLADDSAIINANKINLSTAEGIGVNLQPGVVQNLSDANAVTNNFIVAGTGININSESANVNIANNSIMADNYPVDATGTSLGIHLVNNILINSSLGPAYRYGGSVNQLQQEDYNVLVNTSGALVSLDGVDYSDLADYQSAMQVLGKSHGQNSRSVAVTFKNAAIADLHLVGGSVGDPNLAGLPLDYLVDDYDGHTRSVSVPYIGADESVVLTSASFVFTSAGGLVVSENGTTDSFTVELSSQPADNVSLGLSVSDASHASLGDSSLTFTPANWNVPQEVMVTGIDDNVITVNGGVYFGNHALTVITATSVSNDANYNGINPPDLNLTVGETTSTTISINPGTDAAEPSTDGHFVINIDNGTTSNIDTEVTAWSLAGSATENVDYSLLPADLVIPAGSSSSDVFIATIDDADVEGAESIIFTLSGTNHDAQAMSVKPGFSEAVIELLDDEPVPVGDLSVTIDNGTTSVENGDTLIYTIQIMNTGGASITQVSVTSATPLGGLINLGWSCAAGAGASCGGPGSGDISDTVSLNAGAGVTYTMSAEVDANPDTYIKLEVTAEPTSGPVPKAVAEDKDPVKLWFKNSFE